MSPIAPIISFLLGLFGIAFAGAIALTPEAPVRFAQMADAPTAVECPQRDPCAPGLVPYDYDENGCSTGACQEEYTDGQCIKDNQRSIEDFNRYQIKEGERRLKELDRNKFVVPADIRALVTQMKSMHAKAGGIADCQELSNASQEMNQVANDFNDRIRDIEDAMNDARCIKDAQRELKDFERYAIKEPERKIAQAKKQKVAIPSAITDGIAHIKELMAQVRKGTNCNDINDVKNEMHSFNNDLQDETRKLDFLMQIPQMIKEITREMKDLERQWKSTVTKAKSSKADLSEFIAKGQQLFDGMQALFSEFKTIIASGDLEQIQNFSERGESEAQDKEDELREIMNIVEALRNAPRYIQGLERRMKDTRRMVKDMQRNQKIDTSALSACLDNLQPVFDAAKSASKQRPVDPDDLADAFSAMEEGMADCDDISRNLQGQQEDNFFGNFGPPEQSPKEMQKS